jgi:GntP family gluconate:H+ symporter
LFAVDPLVILAIGIVTILGLIIGLRTNAFLALIIAAMVVSTLAPGAVDDKMSRVAREFGVAAGNIGIVIALAAIIGQCMMDSGAADRIVRTSLKTLGEKRAGTALMGSGYILAIPVFFDTVFYLLVPLARSLFKRTKRNFLLYVLAIAAGGAVTHTLVPPTPGPLLMAANLKIDLGAMILVGALVALPAAFAGLLTAGIMNRLMPIPMRDLPEEDEQETQVVRAQSSAEEEEARLPGLFVSLLPIVLPVVLISINTVLDTLAKAEARRYTTSVNVLAGPAMAVVSPVPETTLQKAAAWAAYGGNANLALLLSALVAMGVLVRQRGLTLLELERTVEKALMSGGVIILITAAGGAFGAMLKAAQIGPAIEQMFGGGGGTRGMFLLVLGFGVSALLKVAQGSSTVAMITVSGMLAAMVPSAAELGYHPVYLATAIGGGSLVGSWMNDSGFWIVSKMSGLTEVETLKTWTILLVVLGVTAFLVTLLLVTVLPYPLGAPA